MVISTLYVGRTLLVYTSNVVNTFHSSGDFFIPAYQCPHHVERIGTMGDGGKWVCGIERLAHQPSCVVYSFGINGESSFEADVLSRAPGCHVYGYDFSVHSFGPEITQIRDLADRSHFWPYALGPADGHSHGEDPPMWSLESLMRINGHHFIDVLKIDIEGAEFESLGTFVDNLIAKAGGRPENVVLPIGQMQIEIHARGGSGHDTFAPFKKWWEKLESVGFRPFWTEPNMVYMNLVRGVRPDLVEVCFRSLCSELHSLTDFDLVLIHEHPRRPRPRLRTQLVASRTLYPITLSQPIYLDPTRITHHPFLDCSKRRGTSTRRTLYHIYPRIPHARPTSARFLSFQTHSLFLLFSAVRFWQHLCDL